MNKYNLPRFGIFCALLMFVFLFTSYEICLAGDDNEPIDLISLASKAYWHNENKGYLWNYDGRDEGRATIWTDIIGEDGKNYQKVLHTHPQRTDNGYIHGIYRVTVPLNNPILLAKVGFREGAEASNGALVGFTYYDKETDSWPNLTECKMIYYDSRFDSITADLSHFAGKTVDIALTVDTAGNSEQDWVIWKDITLASEIKHEFIFLASGNWLVESGFWWAKAMELDNSYIDVSFRISVPPDIDHTKLDRQIGLLEHYGYPYYITAGASDFIRYHGANMFWDYGAMHWGLENLPNIKGLYLHEVMNAEVHYAPGQNPSIAIQSFDWQHIRRLAECAKKYNKKIVWAEAGEGWGWGLIKYCIDNDPYVKEIFEEFGDVIIPMWANNMDTNDPAFKESFDMSMISNTQVSDTYCRGERGGSIQDWHWHAIKGNLDVPSWDITNYIKINHDNGGSYSQFEYFWPEYQFLKGIKDGKDYICNGI